MLSQAGISPTIQPGLTDIPAISLTQTEYSHLFFNHIIPRACLCVTNSFNGYSSNEIIQQILFKTYRTVTACSFRPSDSAHSNLRDCTESTQTSLKSLYTYRSAFELAVNGQCMGFGTLQLSLLQKIMQWNGKFLCDTWDDKMVHWLINEAHKISVLLHESPLMNAFNDNTPCLRTWLNMVDFCLYWCENSNVFNGLKFEGANKITKNELVQGPGVPIDIKLKNRVTHNRLLKDINAQAMNAHCTINRNEDLFNAENPDELVDVGLGSGIYKVVSSMHKGVLPLKKLFMYQTTLEDGSIDFVEPNNTNYQSSFILHSNPQKIFARDWTNMINFCNGVKSKCSAAGTKALKVTKWLIELIQEIFVLNDQDEISVPYILNLLVDYLHQEKLILSTLKGVSTFYRAWNDSVVKRNDTIYTRHANEPDGLYCVQLLLKIDKLDKFAQENRIPMNHNFDDDYSCIIVACCLEWKSDNVNAQNQFNFEIFSIDNVPTIQITDKRKIINVKNIVQQCYVVHDHVIPCQEDQRGISQMVDPWPFDDDEKSNWVSSRNIDLREGKNHVLPYCGVGWVCRKHKCFNCKRCLNKGRNCSNGNLIYQCIEEQWCYFKAYTIYQGYVNRLFNSRSINELGW